MFRKIERAVYIQRIDPDCKSEYLDAHEDVPEAVTDAMVRGTGHTFELYVRDDIAICILEAESLVAYFETTTSDDAVEEWGCYVADFKREGVDMDAAPDEQVPSGNLVSDLESARAD